MNEINKNVRGYFWASLITTILFVAGIPMIVLGAVNEMFYVMIPGIVFVVVGFYGAPVLWSRFGELREKRRVVDAVVNEHIYSVSALATQMSKSTSVMKNIVAKCFEKGYLKGYLFDGENITANFNKPQQEEIVTEQCEGCGATFSHPKSENGICPYCGRHS